MAGDFADFLALYRAALRWCKEWDHAAGQSVFSAATHAVIADATMALLARFLSADSAHRAQFGLTGPKKKVVEIVMEYDSMVSQRRLALRASVPSPPVDGDGDGGDGDVRLSPSLLSGAVAGANEVGRVRASESGRAGFSPVSSRGTLVTGSGSRRSSLLSVRSGPRC